MDTDKLQPPTARSNANGSSHSLFRTSRFWIPAVACLLASLCVPIAFIAGAIVASLHIFNSRATHQQSRIESFLKEDPAAFGNLRVERASNGWAYPSGTLNNKTDFDRLSERLHEMFGDDYADDMMSHVNVHDEP